MKLSELASALGAAARVDRTVRRALLAAEFHPGVDERTRILLTNIEKEMSQEEVIEYANVYELRSHEEVQLGLGITREVVFKTNRRPLCLSFIEKKLKCPGARIAYLLTCLNGYRSHFITKFLRDRG